MEKDEEFTEEERRRRVVILEMLADRDRRQPLSREEFKRMRDEGRC